jgi:hypothetical protein
VRRVGRDGTPPRRARGHVQRRRVVESRLTGGGRRRRSAIPSTGSGDLGVGRAGAALDGADEELRQGSGSWSGEAEPPRRSLSGGASVAVEAFLGGEQVAGVGVCVNEAA